MFRLWRRLSESSILPWIAMTIIVALFLVFQFTGDRPSPQATPLPTVTTSDWALYFTEPGSSTSQAYRGGPDEALARAIDQADYSIDVAAYRLDLWSIRDVLIRAHRRGVDVRIVTDSDHILEDEIQDLIKAGIEVHGDEREALMHHKFVVIDQSEVWTGSMNLTVNGAYRNNNNLLRCASQAIGADYRREFDEMFVENRYGQLSRDDTPYPEVELDSGSVRVMFSPDEDVERMIVSALRTAEHEIVVMAFSLTSDLIGEVLLEQADRGIEVRGVFERSQANNPGSEFDRLVEAGLDFYLDANPDNMHHKVMIIDGETVLTGSYNFSRAASEDNDENMLLIRDRQIAANFLLEFDRLTYHIEPGE